MTDRISTLGVMFTGPDTADVATDHGHYTASVVQPWNNLMLTVVSSELGLSQRSEWYPDWTLRTVLVADGASPASGVLPSMLDATALVGRAFRMRFLAESGREGAL